MKTLSHLHRHFQHSNLSVSLLLKHKSDFWRIKLAAGSSTSPALSTSAMDSAAPSIHTIHNSPSHPTTPTSDNWERLEAMLKETESKQLTTTLLTLTLLQEDKTANICTDPISGKEQKSSIRRRFFLTEWERHIKIRALTEGSHISGLPYGRLNSTITNIRITEDGVALKINKGISSLTEEFLYQELQRCKTQEDTKKVYDTLLLLHAAGINCLRPQTGTFAIIPPQNFNMLTPNTNRIIIIDLNNLFNMFHLIFKTSIYPLLYDHYTHLFPFTHPYLNTTLSQEPLSGTMKSQDAPDIEISWSCLPVSKLLTGTLNNSNLPMGTQVKSEQPYTLPTDLLKIKNRRKQIYRSQLYSGSMPANTHSKLTMGSKLFPTTKNFKYCTHRRNSTLKKYTLVSTIFKMQKYTKFHRYKYSNTDSLHNKLLGNTSVQNNTTTTIILLFFRKRHGQQTHFTGNIIYNNAGNNIMD